MFSTKSEVRQSNFSHPWISEDIHEIFQNNKGAQKNGTPKWKGLPIDTKLPQSFPISEYSRLCKYDNYSQASSLF